MSTNSPQRLTLRPTALQQAWLQEIGIDRRLLSLVAPPEPGIAVQPQTQAQSGTAAEPDTAVRRLRVPETTSASGQPAKAAKVPTPTPTQEPPVAPLVPAGNLQALAEQAAVCQRCRLHEGRGAVVFGAGALAPQWLVVGEAPDAHDDRAGLPFAGPAGELLRAMLQAVGIDRDSQVYATSLVKCRPLGNRPPEPDERQACAGFLDQQLALLAPERILALGETAARHFAGPEATLESLRGSVLDYRLADGSTVPVYVTHHPATLLFCPPLKAEAWYDLLQATGRL